MKKSENTLVAIAKNGFTLVELLVVVAILGILGSVAVVNVAGYIDKSRETTAKMGVDNIDGAIERYNMTHNSKLTDLKQLIETDSDGNAALKGGEGALYDPWGNEYRLIVKGTRNKSYVVISDGLDKIPDTEDDIRSDKIDVKKDK